MDLLNTQFQTNMYEIVIRLYERYLEKSGKDQNSTGTDAAFQKTSLAKGSFASTINRISEKYNVDAKLVEAVIEQESGFNPKAVSSCGAIGLMQLMPSTASSLGVQDPYDPEQNIEGGVKYLREMLDNFDGNVQYALAAYNAGPGAVEKYDGIPPYQETRTYVKNIIENYKNSSFSWSS